MSLGPVICSTGCSILAGCSLSTSLSRAYLRDPVSECPNSAEHTIGQHVDDLAQLVRADTDSQVVEAAVHMGIHLARGITGSQLDISGKSRVLASTPDVARAIQRGLQREGIPIEAASTPEDLGVTMSCGLRRAVSSMTDRIAKGSSRAKRTQALVREM